MQKAKRQYRSREELFAEELRRQAVTWAALEFKRLGYSLRATSRGWEITASDGHVFEAVDAPEFIEMAQLAKGWAAP